MLKPLEQFICDTCGEVIERPEDGYLEWLGHWDGRVSGFHIIHAKWTSPLRSQGIEACHQYEHTSGRRDLQLSEFTGSKTAGYMSVWLDVGVQIDSTYKGPRCTSIREWTELFRRLALPFYEEARLYFSEAIADDETDDPGNPHVYANRNFLKRVVEKYSVYPGQESLRMP